jgi:hypothetical protein
VKSTHVRHQFAGVVANSTLDRTAGSHSLAAAGQRGRYAYQRPCGGVMPREPDFVPEDTRTDQALELAGTAASVVPWLGGPLSAVLSGISFGRKIDRVKEVVNGVVADLHEFRSEVSEGYVQTDEFQDLLEAALKRASEERNEEKRKIYRDFVVNAIRRPGGSYDDQLRVLRTLEELTPDHLRLLAAVAQAPPKLSGGIGSPSPNPVEEARRPYSRTPRRIGC